MLIWYPSRFVPIMALHDRNYRPSKGKYSDVESLLKEIKDQNWRVLQKVDSVERGSLVLICLLVATVNVIRKQGTKERTNEKLRGY